MHRGPHLPRTGPILRKPAQSVRGVWEMADSNGLPAGPGGQRPREAESVRSEGGRQIKSGSTTVARRLHGNGVRATETLALLGEGEGLT
jgi:hypothetical protein